MTRVIDVPAYKAMLPHEQTQAQKFLLDNGIDINDVFEIVVEELPSGAQRMHVKKYRRDETGHIILDVNAEIAIDVVTIYTDRYDQVL